MHHTADKAHSNCDRIIRHILAQKFPIKLLLHVNTDLLAGGVALELLDDVLGLGAVGLLGRVLLEGRGLGHAVPAGRRVGLRSPFIALRAVELILAAKKWQRNCNKCQRVSCAG